MLRLAYNKTFTPKPEDTTILDDHDFQHHFRRTLIFQDRVNIKNLETIACRQILVEKELKAVTSKLKKELAELKEQAEYLTQLVVSNRLNLLSVLKSQVQTSSMYPPVVALHDDLQGRIYACTNPSYYSLKVSGPRLIMMVMGTIVSPIFLLISLKR